MTRGYGRQILLGLLLLSGVAACTWSSVRPDGDVTRRVYVGGELQADDAHRVAQAAAPYLGVPLFDVDMQGIATALQSLPWITNVSIDRHWPDGIVIRAREHQAIARWGDASVLTADFSIITPRQHAELTNLPQLAGPKGTGKRVYTRFQRMNQRLAARASVRIVHLSLDARGSWRAALDNGLVLRFGRKHLAARLQRFIDFALGQARPALADAGYVDLRYSDGFAVGGTRTATAQEKGNEQKA